MRVLYVLNSTLVNNGATRAILGLVQEMKCFGVKPLFLVPDRQGLYLELKNSGEDVFCLNYRPAIYPKKNGWKNFLLFFPRVCYQQLLNQLAANNLKKVLSQYGDIDLIHTNSSVINVGRIAATQLGIKHVQHIREYGDLDFHMHYFPTWASYHRLLQPSSINYVLSITKGVAKHHGVWDMPYASVVYDGVRTEKEELIETQRENCFLFAGRIEYAKGLDLLLEAYGAYISQSVQKWPLIVAGAYAKGDYAKQIEKCLKKYHIQSLVRFLGEVNDVVSLYRKAKALIIPSRNEGFGFCMPEAMFEGCLCVAYQQAGTQEQLDNGKEFTSKDIALGYGSLSQLTDILLDIETSDYSKWNTMRKCAFSTVNHLYTYSQSANKVFNIYESLL